MRLAVDEQARREICCAFHRDDIGLSFRRFRHAAGGERQRIATEGHREHPEREPREILLEHRNRIRRRTGRTSSSTRTRRRLPRACLRRWTAPLWRWRRVGKLNQAGAVEAAPRRPAFLRWDFIRADVLIRQLDRDLEFDRNQVVAAHLPRAARDDKCLDGRDSLVSTQRFPRSEHDRLRGIARLDTRGLRRSSLLRAQCDRWIQPETDEEKCSEPRQRLPPAEEGLP